MVLMMIMLVMMMMMMMFLLCFLAHPVVSDGDTHTHWCKNSSTEF